MQQYPSVRRAHRELARALPIDGVRWTSSAGPDLEPFKAFEDRSHWLHRAPAVSESTPTHRPLLGRDPLTPCMEPRGLQTVPEVGVASLCLRIMSVREGRFCR